MVLGGHGWGGVLCRIFPINSLLTVCKHFGIRAYHYTNMGYMWAACPIRRHFAARKKVEKFLNTPLRINAAFGRLVAFPRKREHPFGLWKLNHPRVVSTGAYVLVDRRYLQVDYLDEKRIRQSPNNCKRNRRGDTGGAYE